MFDPEKLIRKGPPKGWLKDMLVKGALAGVTYFIGVCP